MASDPTAAYRKQQGLAPITQSFDPIVVKWTQQAAAATGADPVVLLATAIQEAGARRGAVGDRSSGYASYGPWQMRETVGALGNRSPAWANSYQAALNRAKEFARLKVHGGVGAAAIQRPANRALYAQGIESHMEQARAILGRQPALKATPATPGAPQSKAAPARALEGAAGLDAAGKQAFIQALYSDAPASDLASLVQQASETGARPAGGSRAVVSPAKAGAQQNANGKVIAGPAKIIGRPHSGTHTLGNWESDDAVDIAMPVGTPIYAAFDGTIGSRIGALTSSKSSRFAGERLHLQGAGNELYYAHLSRLAVKAGQKVRRGELIGYSGSANGVAHLHLGARDGNPGAYA